MTYIDYLNSFNRWLESNALPGSSRLLYYSLLDLFNRTGWARCVQVDNRRLILMADVRTEKAVIAARNALVDAGFIIYQRGKKGSPGRYILSEIHCPQNSKNDSKNDSHNKTKKNTKKKTFKEREERNDADSFLPPSREEIEAYCREAHISIDIDRYIDHYSSVGWRVGNTTMKDWKATVRNWQRRDREFGTSANTGNTALRSFDTDEFFEAASKKAHEKLTERT